MRGPPPYLYLFPSLPCPLSGCSSLILLPQSLTSSDTFSSSIRHWVLSAMACSRKLCASASWTLRLLICPSCQHQGDPPCSAAAAAAARRRLASPHLPFQLPADVLHGAQLLPQQHEAVLLHRQVPLHPSANTTTPPRPPPSALLPPTGSLLRPQQIHMKHRYTPILSGGWPAVSFTSAARPLAPPARAIPLIANPAPFPHSLPD